jgi:uncharacterized membrane protein YdfJ with MMPL/SSD domain
MERAQAAARDRVLARVSSRSVLLPATMTLLGEWNRYLPRTSSRLPRADIEAPPAGEPL